MTSKCWFVLRHPHPPPILPQLGIGQARGQICPGHLIPHLRELDHVINPLPEKYPPDMPLGTTTAFDLEWDSNDEIGPASLGATGTAAADALATSATSLISVAFKKTVKQHWKFDSVKHHTITLSQSYLDDTMDSPEAVAFHKKHPLSSMYMITGIIVAQGAQKTIMESRERSVTLAPRIDIAPAGIMPRISLGTDTKYRRQITEETSSRIEESFVWAVRLAKVSKKGIIDREWSPKLVRDGANFGLDNKPQQGAQVIRTRLADEGMENFELLVAEDEECIFVLGQELG